MKLEKIFLILAAATLCHAPATARSSTRLQHRTISASGLRAVGAASRPVDLGVPASVGLWLNALQTPGIAVTVETSDSRPGAVAAVPLDESPAHRIAVTAETSVPVASLLAGRVQTEIGASGRMTAAELDALYVNSITRADTSDAATVKPQPADSGLRPSGLAPVETRAGATARPVVLKPSSAATTAGVLRRGIAARAARLAGGLMLMAGAAAAHAGELLAPIYPGNFAILAIILAVVHLLVSFGVFNAIRLEPGVLRGGGVWIAGLTALTVAMVSVLLGLSLPAIIAGASLAAMNIAIAAYQFAAKEESRGMNIAAGITHLLLTLASMLLIFITPLAWPLFFIVFTLSSALAALAYFQRVREMS